MDISMHRINQILAGRIKKYTTDDNRAFYARRLYILNENSKLELCLFSDKREALKIEQSPR
jgi:hypothetical protein